jgi:voltage-gated potassium channel
MNKKDPLRWRLFKLIRDDDNENNLANTIFGSIIMFLIIVNVVIIILDTFENISINLKNIFLYIETITVIIFTLEYIARLWTAIYVYPNKKHIIAQIKFMFTSKAVIDLISIIPFYLPFIFPIENLLFLRILRVLRFSRLLKLNRYTDALTKIKNVVKDKSYQLICSLSFVIILMILSSVLMYYIENDKQPDVFENAFSGLWWGILTITTVGYGDIYPVTGLGKLLGAFIALLGVGLIAVPTGILSAGFIEQKKKKNNNDKKYCPYCGKKKKFKRARRREE